MTPMRKKTLRRLPLETRKLARLIGELESVQRRLKNFLPVVQDLELWARAAQAKEKPKLVNPESLKVVSEETIPFDPETNGGLITGLGEYRKEAE